MDAAIDNYLCSELVTPENDSGHPCDFEDEEEGEFSYLLVILLLIASALSIICTRCPSPFDCFVCTDMFDMLQKNTRNELSGQGQKVNLTVT